MAPSGMAGKCSFFFHASAGVAIQGTWLQPAGLSRFGFPFGGPTTSRRPLPIAECTTRRSTPAHAAATASRIFPPPSHGCATARCGITNLPGNAIQCQHTILLRAQANPARETKQTPGRSPHSPGMKVRAVSRNLAHSHAGLGWDERQMEEQHRRSTARAGIKVVRSTVVVEASLAMGHSDCILLMQPPVVNPTADEQARRRRPSSSDDPYSRLLLFHRWAGHRCATPSKEAKSIPGIA